MVSKSSNFLDLAFRCWKSEVSTVNLDTFLKLNCLTTGGRDFVLFFSVEYDPDSKRKNHVVS